MSLSVNGIVIDARRVADEIDQHRDAADPETAAQHALVSRELLRQRVRDLRLLGDAEMAGASDDAIVDALFTRDVHVRRPTEAECRAYFHEHAGQFRVGDQVQASHILFALSAGVPLSVTLSRAQATLDRLRVEPAAIRVARGERVGLSFGAKRRQSRDAHARQWRTRVRAGVVLR